MVAPRLAQFADRLVQRLKCLTGCGRQTRTFARERQPLALANKERHAQIFLELLDLLADRSLGHVQLLGGEGEAVVAGDRIEATQPGQQGRGEMIIH